MQRTVGRERLEADRHAEPERGQIDFRVRAAEVQIGGHLAVVKHERGLDQAGNAGRGLGVADVGLDRSDPEHVTAAAAPRELGAE